MLVYEDKLPFFVFVMPEACLPVGRSLIGHPESIEKTGFSSRVFARVASTRSTDYGNDGINFDFIHRRYIGVDLLK